MINVTKHLDYWQRGASDDWESAQVLLSSGKIRQALFFGHLALEKALKGLVTRTTGDIPPRTHDLLRLAELAKAI